MMTDTLADMLTRIRNGQNAKLAQVNCIYSKLNHNSLKVLKEEGYIKDIIIDESVSPIKEMTIQLKYHAGQGAIIEIARVSKPGRKVHESVDDIKPFYTGLGINVVSTDKGVMTDREARAANIGGEVLFKVY